MSHSPPSLIEDLNAVIQNFNPFDESLIVRDKNIWGLSFPDVPSLNAHASNAVFQAIKEARRNKSVNSITITAEAGSGKSHIISRIKHHLPDEGNVLFVYMHEYSNLKLIKCQFQRVLADSLNRFGSKEVTQWQELAAAMVNQTRGINQSPKKIVEEFSRVSLDVIDDLTTAIQKEKPDVDPDIVKAILWTLSPNRSSHASKWLSGRVIPIRKADELDLPHSREQENEADAFDTVKQVLGLISDYYSLIICFDELDGIGHVDPDQSDPTIGGYTQPQVVANFIKDLFNNLNQGTILTVMEQVTWKHQIEEGMSSSSAVKDRLSSKKDPIPLNPIDEQSIIELVSLRLKDFYAERKVSPPNPIYPFTQTQLKEFAKRKLPVRDVLNWCRNNFKVSDTLGGIGDTLEEVREALKKELEINKIDNLNLDDNTFISNILLSVLNRFVGQVIEGVVIENVARFDPKIKKKNYINFKIVGKKSGKTVNAGVAVLQDSHHNSVKACLSQLIDCNSLGLTCSYLVRSSKKPVNGNSRTLLNQLTSTSKGGLVNFQTDDLKTLVAIESVYNKRQDYDLSDEQINNYILKEGSPMVKDIISLVTLNAK
jgi:hypothetical protein